MIALVWCLNTYKELSNTLLPIMQVSVQIKQYIELSGWSDEYNRKINQAVNIL